MINLQFSSMKAWGKLKAPALKEVTTAVPKKEKIGNTGKAPKGEDRGAKQGKGPKEI